MAKREHRYYAGLTPEEKAMAKKSEQRGKALADDDPKKYEEWDSDKSFKERGGKTQESKYTKAFHEKYGARTNAKLRKKSPSKQEKVESWDTGSPFREKYGSKWFAVDELLAQTGLFLRTSWPTDHKSLAWNDEALATFAPRGTGVQRSRRYKRTMVPWNGSPLLHRYPNFLERVRVREDITARNLEKGLDSTLDPDFDLSLPAPWWAKGGEKISDLDTEKAHAKWHEWIIPFEWNSKLFEIEMTWEDNYDYDGVLWQLKIKLMNDNKMTGKQWDKMLKEKNLDFIDWHGWVWDKDWRSHELEPIAGKNRNKFNKIQIPKRLNEDGSKSYWRRNPKEDAPDYRPFDIRPFWNAEYQNFADCGNCKWWDAYGDGFGHCKAFDFSCKEDHLCDGHPDIVHAINAGEWITGIGLVDSVEVIENPRVKKKVKAGPKSLLDLNWSIDYEMTTYGTDYPLQLLYLEHDEYDRGFHVEMKYDFDEIGRISPYDNERRASAKMIIKTKHNLDLFAGYEQSTSTVRWILPIAAEDNWGEYLPAEITINRRDYDGTFEGKYVSEEAQDFLREYGIMQMTSGEIKQIALRIFEMKQSRPNPKVKKKAKGSNKWWKDTSWRKQSEHYDSLSMNGKMPTVGYDTGINLSVGYMKSRPVVWAEVSHQIGEPNKINGQRDIVQRRYKLRPTQDMMASGHYEEVTPAGVWRAAHIKDRNTPVNIARKESYSDDWERGWEWHAAGKHGIGGYTFDELNNTTLSMLNELTYDDILSIWENQAMYDKERKARLRDDDWMLVRNAKVRKKPKAKGLADKVSLYAGPLAMFAIDDSTGPASATIIFEHEDAPNRLFVLQDMGTDMIEVNSDLFDGYEIGAFQANNPTEILNMTVLKKTKKEIEEMFKVGVKGTSLAEMFREIDGVSHYDFEDNNDEAPDYNAVLSVFNQLNPDIDDSTAEMTIQLIEILGPEWTDMVRNYYGYIDDKFPQVTRNPSKVEFNEMNAQQVQAYATPGWRITKSENWSDQEGTGHYFMEKKYGFENFDDVEDFVKMLNSMITELDHHPEIGYEYDKVVVRTWSHDTKSVSERDYVLSEAIDLLYDTFQKQRKQAMIDSATPYQHEANSSAHTSGNTDLSAEIATLNPKIRKKPKSKPNFKPALLELFSAKDFWKEWIDLPFSRNLSLVIRNYDDNDATMQFTYNDSPLTEAKWLLQISRNFDYSGIDVRAAFKNLTTAMGGTPNTYAGSGTAYSIVGSTDIDEEDFKQVFISVMNDLGIPELRFNPIREGKDDDGHFYRWGKQAKYYFDPKSEKSKKAAYEKSRKQAAAIFSSGYRPKQNPKKKDGDKKKFVAEVSKKTGIKKSILAKVYDKGIAAWGSGHRPGTNPVQWAKARVYAFVEKGGPVFNKKGGKGPDHSLAVEAGLVKAEKNPRVRKKPTKGIKWWLNYNWSLIDEPSSDNQYQGFLEDGISGFPTEVGIIEMSPEDYAFWAEDKNDGYYYANAYFDDNFDFGWFDGEIETTGTIEETNAFQEMVKSMMDRITREDFEEVATDATLPISRQNPRVRKKAVADKKNWWEDFDCREDVYATGIECTPKEESEIYFIRIDDDSHYHKDSGISVEFYGMHDQGQTAYLKDGLLDVPESRFSSGISTRSERKKFREEIEPIIQQISSDGEATLDMIRNYMEQTSRKNPKVRKKATGANLRPLWLTETKPYGFWWLESNKMNSEFYIKTPEKNKTLSLRLFENENGEFDTAILVRTNDDFDEHDPRNFYSFRDGRNNPPNWSIRDTKYIKGLSNIKNEPNRSRWDISSGLTDQEKAWLINWAREQYDEYEGSVCDWAPKSSVAQSNPKVRKKATGDKPNYWADIRNVTEPALFWSDYEDNTVTGRQMPDSVRRDERRKGNWPYFYYGMKIDPDFFDHMIKRKGTKKAKTAELIGKYGIEILVEPRGILEYGWYKQEPSLEDLRLTIFARPGKVSESEQLKPTGEHWKAVGESLRKHPDKMHRDIGDIIDHAIRNKPEWWKAWQKMDTVEIEFNFAEIHEGFKTDFKHHAEEAIKTHGLVEPITRNPKLKKKSKAPTNYWYETASWKIKPPSASAHALGRFRYASTVVNSQWGKMTVRVELDTKRGTAKIKVYTHATKSLSTEDFKSIYEFIYQGTDAKFDIFGSMDIESGKGRLWQYLMKQPLTNPKVKKKAKGAAKYWYEDVDWQFEKQLHPYSDERERLKGKTMTPWGETYLRLTFYPHHGYVSGKYQPRVKHEMNEKDLSDLGKWLTNGTDGYAGTDTFGNSEIEESQSGRLWQHFNDLVNQR